MAFRIVVTGIGFTSCIGNSKTQVANSLESLTSGIQEHHFYDNPNLRVKAIGKPTGFEFPSSNWRSWELPQDLKIDSSILRSLPPHGVYAYAALQEAMADAGFAKADLANSDTGLYCASAGSPMLLHNNLSALEKANGERGNPMGILSSISGSLNFNLGSWLGNQGTNCGFVSACTSSSHALGYAFDDIALGRQKRAIVVGAEDATAESLMPFAAMRALSTNPDITRASRPFDAGRDGFVGAGGSAVLILEEETAAKKRGAEIYATFESWAQTSDGYHRASPHPEGHGLQKAIRRAIEIAGVNPDDIDYINAHATSTIAGDAAEATAIGNVFSQQQPLTSSTKALTGHGLSMAGALEAAICCLSLKKQLIPGNAHLEKLAPECAHLNIPLKSENRPINRVLNNSSGFGGSNVCHVFKAFS